MAPKGEEARRWQRNDGKKGSPGSTSGKNTCSGNRSLPSAVGHRPLSHRRPRRFPVPLFSPRQGLVRLPSGKDDRGAADDPSFFQVSARAFPAKGEGLFPFSPGRSGLPLYCISHCAGSGERHRCPFGPPFFTAFLQYNNFNSFPKAAYSSVQQSCRYSSPAVRRRFCSLAFPAFYVLPKG
jgi:hypothetical protein